MTYNFTWFIHHFSSAKSIISLKEANENISYIIYKDGDI